MSGHTPGPWRLRSPAADSMCRHQILGRPHPVDGGDYAPICEVAHDNDARLIAAAPELLAALQEIIRESDKLSEHEFRLAAAAIAKAGAA